MTPLIGALLAVFVAVVIGVVTFIVMRRGRAESGNKQTSRAVAMPCATNGHAYQIFETGWRCAVCGNHVPRVEGEVYGPAKDGLRERRREDR